MPPPPIKVAVPDAATLLRVSLISLAGDLRVSASHPGRIIVRHAACDQALVLNPLQWAALRTFIGGRSVPATLKHLVYERSAIPVRELYELILQGLEVGVLTTPGYPAPPPARPSVWSASVNTTTIRALAGGVGIVALVLLLANPISASSNPLWWALGWACWALAASAGAWLRASLVHASGGDVYRARIHWKSALPRFEADTRDALFYGPQALIDQALADLLPYAAFCAAASVFAPPLAFPLWCGLLAALAPLPGRPGLALLRARFHFPVTTASRGLLFTGGSGETPHRARALFTRENMRFALAWAGCTLPWTLAIAATLLVLAPHSWTARLFDGHGRPDWATIAALATSLAAAAALAGAWFVVHRLFYRKNINLRSAPGAAATAPAQAASTGQKLPLVGEIATFLADTHPFQNLPAANRQGTASTLRPVPFSAGDILIEKGETYRRLHIIYSGEARIDAAQTHLPALPLSSGCLFGEACLLEGKSQPVAVRAHSSGIRLVLEYTDYLAHVAPHVPPHKLEDAARKVAFLRQAALARKWPAHHLDSFARRATLHEFAHGDTVLHEGHENVWFNLVIDGELHALRNGRRIGKLGPGDFFGEISLLQRGFANAAVIGHRPGRFLAIPRNDFLVFFAHDPDIALQIEDIANRRLGRPVFPV